MTGFLAAGLFLLFHLVQGGGQSARTFLILGATAAFIFSYSENLKFRNFSIGFLVLVAMYAVHSFVHIYPHIFRTVQEWDFLCYFLDGKIAVANMNFYDPETYRAIAKFAELPRNPSPEFQTEIIDVGFGLNPPPSMFMFLPLGYFSYLDAHVNWISFITICLITSISLSVPVFFTEKRTRIAGILFFISLALLWAPSRKTLSLGQTNFTALCMLMLFWWKAKSPVSGVFAALAMFVKPILLVLPGILLIRRNGKAFGYAITTSVVLSLLSILVFGWDTFSSFFSRLPTTHISNLVLSESQNQSLMATLMRIGEDTVWENPYLLAFLSTFILGLSTYFVVKTQEKNLGWAISVALTGFLLVYPGTLSHYGVLLLPVIVFFLSEWKTLPGKSERTICFLAVIAIIFLTGTFWANLIAWILSLGISAYKIATLHT